MAPVFVDGEKVTALKGDTIADDFIQMLKNTSLSDMVRCYHIPAAERGNEKISGLMTKLGVSSKATWAEDECLIWVTDLLEVKELSEWVHKSISNFSVSYENLLHKRAHNK